MEKIKAFFKIIKPYINKYTIVVALFLVLLFFSKYSIIERIKLYKSVTELEREKEQSEKNIIEAQKQLHQLNTTNENLERMARENYRMHKQDEEVFIIDEDNLKVE